MNNSSGKISGTKKKQISAMLKGENKHQQIRIIYKLLMSGDLHIQMNECCRLTFYDTSFPGSNKKLSSCASCSCSLGQDCDLLKEKATDIFHFIARKILNSSRNH